jgi:hypothetical protein
MAATRCLTVLRALVAIDKAAWADFFTALPVFFAAFARFAVLRFVTMVAISSCEARQANFASS